MSSPCNDSNRSTKRIDLLFSKFAVFYGHIWRSQFKDEVFLKFAKKEWQEGLNEFHDAVVDEVILNCREQLEMPPTLPQLIQLCRQVKKRKEFRVKAVYQKAQESIADSQLSQCKKLLM